MPVAQRVQAIEQACKSMGPLGVQTIGWQSQPKVLELMKSSGVYCYPGGPMPEGFGVSMVQAQACGVEVLAPEQGALPEVLGDFYSLLEKREDPAEVAKQLIERLSVSISDERRRKASAWTLEQHGWPVVAKRFLSFVLNKHEASSFEYYNASGRWPK